MTDHAVTDVMPAAPPGNCASTFRKINVRLLPFLLLCYVLAYLDRVNIGFAKLAMQSEAGIGDAVYGLGAGIFFVGYFLFEVPSNLLQTRIGVRRTISRIMVLWGCCSVAMIFVRGPYSFYTLRFLLGVFEAGFAPGMLLYLTLWYPAAQRARIMAFVLLAGPVSNIIGGPVSGFAISMLDGVAGLAGWKWLFIVEGLPSVVVGITAFFYLDDRPKDARWLTDAERQQVAQALSATERGAQGSFLAALRNPRVYALAMVYFSTICGLYTASFWLPTLLREAGVTNLRTIGYITAIPYIGAVVAMLLNARSSDLKGERRLHYVVPSLAGAAGLAMAAFDPHNLVVAMIGLGLATIATYAAYSVFWAAPTSAFKGTAAAGGIALINCIGALGGFVSPTVIGFVKDLTGSLGGGLFAMAAIIGLGALVRLSVRLPGDTLRS
ncbi:MFS transporter [Azospirillum canadense]|uniref:MFS transporter n=1 Tax=Azospirillum canadense TaxID=403962 RepID=UPI002226D47B|nr:MFS transporter [Azospirillum canadense]MCW2240481.1 MFS family permease [Azospirillum canadense]